MTFAGQMQLSETICIECMRPNFEFIQKLMLEFGLVIFAYHMDSAETVPIYSLNKGN